MEKQKYAVDTKVFDSGRVTVSAPYKTDLPEVVEDHKTFTFYRDTFNTMRQAQQFVKESREG